METNRTEYSRHKFKKKGEFEMANQKLEDLLNLALEIRHNVKSPVSLEWDLTKIRTDGN